MKKTKILAGVMALSMMLPCSSAFAEPTLWQDKFTPASKGMSETYILDDTTEDSVNEDGKIMVMLDGNYISFNDAVPVNDNGRVKLPFRELLENMGASVSYDESQRKVTAERNGVQIEFSLDSNIIYINDNGNTSEFVMDTSIDVINDRTFVPVRFMAEAFGLTVGWDEEFDAVVITDVDGYVKKISEACSNYMKVGELGYAFGNNYSTNQMLSFSLDITNMFGENPEVSNIKANMVSTTETDRNIIENHNTLSLSSLNMIKEDQQVDLKDIEFNIIMQGEKLYISTNIVEALKEANPDNKTIAMAAEVITSGTWLEGTLSDLLVKFFGMDESMCEMLTSMLTEPQSFDKALSAMFSTFDENSALSAMVTGMQVNAMTYLFGDNLFKLTQEADGSYVYSYELTEQAFADYLKAVISASGEWNEQSEKELNTMLESMDFNMVINGNITDSDINSKVILGFAMNSEIIKINAEFTVESESKAGVVDFSGYVFPENTKKLSTILSILKSQMD